MSALTPVEGEAFKVTIFKSLVANPALVWRNTYEIKMGSTPSTSVLVGAMETIAVFERGIHLNTVLVEYGIASTWTADSNPYGGDEFSRVDYNLIGGIVPVGDPEPLQICLNVAFGASTGRTGYRMYRGCLSEADVTSTAGNPRMTNITTINTRIGDAILASSIDDLIGATIGNAALILKNPETERLVGSIGARKVSVKKLNNKYFNQSTL